MQNNNRLALIKSLVTKRRLETNSTWFASFSTSTRKKKSKAILGHEPAAPAVHDLEEEVSFLKSTNPNLR